MQLESSRLASLLCKLKALSSWRRLVDQEKLHQQLLQAQQVSRQKSEFSLQDDSTSSADNKVSKVRESTF